MNAMFLGLNVGGTTCSAALGDRNGQVLRRVAWPSRTERGPQPMIDDLVTQARALMAAESVTPLRAGVAIGGPLDARRGVIANPPNLPGWDRVPLADLLERALELPVNVEHDAAACALAEHKWGAGRGSDTLAYLTCGTGFGVGLILGGKPYYGAHGATPEIGHVQYRDRGPRAYEKVGSFEAYGSAAALQRLAACMFPERWASSFPTPQDVARLAATGDDNAAAVLSANATAVGDAAAMLADLLALEKILLGSLANYLGAAWIAQVRHRFEQQIGPWLVGRCVLEPATLGTQLQDCSAIAAAIGHEITATSTA